MYITLQFKKYKGHMDFYPDGGNDHPECRKDDTPSCSKSGYWNSLRCKIESKAKALISSTAGKIVGIEDEVYLKNGNENFLQSVFQELI